MMRILSAMGYADNDSAATENSGTMIPCPACPDGIVLFHEDHQDGMLGICNACDWTGDAFAYYMARNQIEDPAAAVAALRAAKVKVPAACGKTASLRSYQKYLRSCKAFAAFHLKMSRRNLTSLSGQPIVALETKIRPHNAPHWWCTTMTELKYDLGGDVVSADGHGWADVKRVAGSEETPVLVMPSRDGFGRVTGVWIMGEVDETYLEGHSHPDGVALLEWTGKKRPESWNNKQVVTSQPFTAVALAAAGLRDFGAMLPVCLTRDSGTEAVKRQLGLAAVTSSYVVWPDTHPAGVDAADLCLARRLGAPVALVESTENMAADCARWVRQNVIGGALPWLEAAEAIFAARSDWNARVLLGEIGWCPKVAEKAKSLWRPAQYDRAMTLMNTTDWRDVPVTDKLIVTDTVEGLVNTVNGHLLYEAAPVVTKTYRGDDGRTRYRGLIRYRGGEYQFDSASFRKDPVAVIEAVLLRAGVEPPTPHPMLVPHLANVAAYMTGCGVE